MKTSQEQIDLVKSIIVSAITLDIESLSYLEDQFYKRRSQLKREFEAAISA